MNTISKIETAQLVLTDEKKKQIVDVLKSHYGVGDVQYKDMNYGISIDIDGITSFRFIKQAIIKILNINDDALSILSENEKLNKATYVYLPEKDKNVTRLLKKINKLV